MTSPFQAPSFKTLRYDDSEMQIWLPRPSVLLARVRGYLRHEFAEEVIRHLNGMNRTQPIVQFHDWLQISGFDIRCQRDLTAWHVTNYARIARLDIAAHSAFVRMGVAVANVALKGSIRLYDEPGSFERQAELALASAVEKRAL